MRWQQPARYCPNCGKELHDGTLSMNHVMSLMCTNECRELWERKYATMILRNKEKADVHD